MATGFQVTFDAADTRALGQFWAEALGYVEQSPPPGFESWEAWATAMGVPEDEWDSLYAVVDPEGKGPRLLFQKVPEPKSAKNRVHLDVIVAGHGLEPDEKRRVVEEHVARLQAVGATRLDTIDRTDRGDAYWVVMQDPEGNEFCVE